MDLILSDLHLTDNPLELYRWSIFPRFYELNATHKFSKVYILGDITEKKDNHGSKLVNQIVQNLSGIRQVVDHLIILRGNHDGMDSNWPFFGFLDKMGIEYYHKPIIVNDELFIPNSKTFKGDLINIIERHMQLSEKLKRIFLHQTFTGAVNFNGFKLEGERTELLEDFDGLVFSGDIHNPQTLGNIVYVGSPYPVYFGDDFAGGGILLDGDKYERITFPSIRRAILELDLTPEHFDIEFPVNEGDQFKVRLLVNRRDSDQFDHWKKVVKEDITERGGKCISVELKIVEEKSNSIKKRKFKDTDPLSILTRHCKAEGLDDFYLEKGKEFL